MTLTITVKCVGCGARKELTGPQFEPPFCDKCMSPMVVLSAEGK